MKTQKQEQIEDAVERVNQRRETVAELTEQLATASREYDEAVRELTDLAVDGASVGEFTNAEPKGIALDLDNPESIRDAAKAVFDKVLASGGFSRLFAA